MSRSIYGQSTLSGLVESESDDGAFEAIDAISTPESAPEDDALRKRRAGSRAVIGKTMKPKAPGRRTSPVKAGGGKGKRARAPLSDKSNEQHAASDTEEVENFDQEDATVNVAPSGDELDVSIIALKHRNPKSTKSRNGNKTQSVVKDQSRVTIEYKSPDVEQIEPPEPVVRKKHSHTRRQTSAEPKQRHEVIQETQISNMDMDDYGDEHIDEPTPRPAARYGSVPRAASQSRQTSVPRRRAGSASDTERNDPAMRRKLGEMTKKFENLDLKYRNLREVATKEAESNFERYRKQSEQSKRAAEALIASLKADIAAQNSLIRESRDVKKVVDTQAADISKLQAKVSQLTSSLSEAHIENKTISAKLAANRTVAATVETVNGRGPGSAVKANGGIRMMGSAEAAQAAQSAQLKEDIYSDLTGLIIRDVKREPEDNVYDCIQTGRNGTLHFKLAVANEKSAESYDDAHCVYIPQLDPSRDKALMEMLPDYLIDEITFPRPHSAKFYARVVKALTEKQS